jgi:hypothetical protein
LSHIIRFMTGGIYPFTFRSLSALEEGQTDPWRQDSLACFNALQVSEKVSSLVGCGARPLRQPTWMFRPILLFSILRSRLVLSMESMKEVGRHTLKASRPRYDGSLNLFECSYLTFRKSSTLPGHEGVLPTSIEDSTYTKPADADTAYNACKDGASTIVSFKSDLLILQTPRQT